MARKFNPFPDPKRGKGRSVLKRPAAVKPASSWKKVKYTRDTAGVGPTGLRMDRIKWKRTIHELLGASDHKIANLLLQDSLLCAWEGKVCPRCGKGSLSKLKKSSGNLPKYRCNAKACHVYLNPHHLHPLFVDGRGSGSRSLQLQAALLLLLLNRVPHPVIHRLLGVKHKAIEDMDKRLRDLRMKWVQEQEKHVNLEMERNGAMWKLTRRHSTSKTSETMLRSQRRQ
jgi:transposase-like protein